MYLPFSSLFFSSKVEVSWALNSAAQLAALCARDGKILAQAVLAALFLKILAANFRHREQKKYR